MIQCLLSACTRLRCDTTSVCKPFDPPAHGILADTMNISHFGHILQPLKVQTQFQSIYL
jgi:hypothetical protein